MDILNSRSPTPGAFNKESLAPEITLPPWAVLLFPHGMIPEQRLGCISQLLSNRYFPATSDSNIVYNQRREQVDWIRYMREDCYLSFGNIASLFNMNWPDEQISSEDIKKWLSLGNRIPAVDQHNEPQFNSKHSLILRNLKKSDYAKGVPISLVDRCPWRAIWYPWVIEEHKNRAKGIVQGTDTTDPTGEKSKWREVLWRIETFILYDIIMGDQGDSFAEGPLPTFIFAEGPLPTFIFTEGPLPTFIS